jgi:hypothetical protein
VRFLAILLLIGTGCRDFAVDSDEGVSARRFRSFDVEVNSPFEIGVGDEAYLADADMTVTFSLVTEDSRCQSDTICDGPGKAGVLLEIARGIGDQSQVLLTIPGLVATPYRLNNYVQHREERFQLQQLNPYPAVNGSGQERVYEATILIDR